MGYVTQYTANFTNEQSQDIKVEIAKRNGGTNPIINYKVVSLKISDNSDEQDTYATIISKELELVIWTEAGDGITWETFITSSHTDWKITVSDEVGNIYFIGFITPDEGHAPFQDEPYEIVIKAIDGLGLLKGYELTDVSDAKFKGFYTLVQYLAGALVKTNLDLPIRIYCNIFHSSMNDKSISLNNDIFHEIELNSRTFLKDVNTYESCYDTLKMILSGWCSIQQYNGKWQIITLSERQYRPGSSYYVDYSSVGTSPFGFIDYEDVTPVGKHELIFPINESQRISSKFANKQVKTSFEYIIPEDLVNNQKLQQFGASISSLSTNASLAYYKVGWSAHYQDPVYQPAYTGSKKSYLQKEIDPLGNETDRYYVLQYDSTIYGNVGYWLRNDNDDFFVDKGDLLNVSLTVRLLDYQSGSDNLTFGTIYILKKGATGNKRSDFYSLNQSGTWINNDLANWAMTPANSFSKTDDITDGNITNWNTISLETQPIPVDGTLYFCIRTGPLSNPNNEVHIKDISIEYTPYIKGSRINVKGDYHLNDSSVNYPDNYKNDVKISDSPKRIIKGTFFYTDNLGVRDKLTPEFYRYPNTSESKNFKQLANLGKYNQTYRRFYKIEGDFTSLLYNTVNDINVRKPLGFHKKYRFVDMKPTRDFVLEPSLEMDMVTGNIKATFVEVYKDIKDGLSTGEVDRFDYIF